MPESVIRTLRVARYRFRATFRRRRGGYLAIVVLTALLGGIAMGTVAGARRNQSAYPAFMASTNASQLTLPTALYGLEGANTGYNAPLLAKIARLPFVQRVESSVQLNGGTVDARGNPVRTPPNFNVGNAASVNGLNFDQDRVTVTQGRMADPARANEVVVSAGVAKVLAVDGIHVGDTVGADIISNAQSFEPQKDVLAHPYLRMNVRLVGVGVLNNAVITDDVDVQGSEFYLFTPALTRRLLQCCATSTDTALRIEGGSRNVPIVESELAALFPNLPHEFFVTSTVVAKIERAVEPESIAFAAFGLIAALAGLLIVGQLIGRQVRFAGDDLEALRALGAGPAVTATDGLIGIVGSIVVGASLAGALAVGVSPLAPIGAVRHVYPSRGIAFDWAVLGIGMLFLTIALSAVAIGLAFRNAPHRAGRRANRVRRSAAARVAASAGFSTPAVAGIRFAFEPGRGKNTVPVRSTILGAVIAIVVVTGTVTFGASLHSLVSHPALYGWNWNYELTGGSGVGAIPQRQSATLLDKDHDVAAWTGVYFASAAIDGHVEPVIAGSPNAPVAPPLLSGHALDAPNQVVLGAVTMAELHKHLGDTVEVGSTSTEQTPLRIVGTATLPAVGGEGSQLHTTMGTGALIAYQLIPAAFRNAQGNTPTGPNAIFVRLRNGVNTNAALHNLDLIATKLSLPTNYGVAIVPVQRPAEIVNYRSMSNTPLYLGVALAVGAITALALTLVASVRRRRRDLALLKTLGYTRRQLAAVVAWQSTISVSIGIVIGIPVGIITGRALWDLFAHAIHAVPQPAVPGSTIAFIAIGAFALANLVAAIPGLQAARTHTAELLRAE